MYILYGNMQAWVDLMWWVFLFSLCCCRNSKCMQTFRKIWVVIFALLSVIVSICELVFVREFLWQTTINDPKFTTWLFNLKIVVIQGALFTSVCLNLWPRKQSEQTFWSLFSFKDALANLAVVAFAFICDLQFYMYSADSYGYDDNNPLFSLNTQEIMNIYYMLTLSMLVLTITGINILSVASFATQIKQEWSKWLNISINVWLVLFALVGLASIIFESMLFASNSVGWYQFFTANRNSNDQNTMAWLASIVCKGWLFGLLAFNVSRKTLKCCQRPITKEVDAIPLEIAE